MCGGGALKFDEFCIFVHPSILSHNWKQTIAKEHYKPQLTLEYMYSVRVNPDISCRYMHKICNTDSGYLRIQIPCMHLPIIKTQAKEWDVDDPGNKRDDKKNKRNLQRKNGTYSRLVEAETWRSPWSMLHLCHSCYNYS